MAGWSVRVRIHANFKLKRIAHRTPAIIIKHDMTKPAKWQENKSNLNAVPTEMMQKSLVE